MSRFLIVLLTTLSCSTIFSQGVNDDLASGKAEFTKGNYTAALQVFKSVIKANPKTKDVYFFAGLTEYNLKDFSKAQYYFSKDIKYNRKDPRSYIYRAKAEERSYHAAMRDLKKASRLGAEKFTVIDETANISFDDKRYKEAFKDFSIELKLRPGTDDTYYKLGFCKYYLKDTPSACNYWNKIIDIDDFEQGELIQKICSK